MKKWIIGLLIVILAFSTLSVSAFADGGGVDVSITVSESHTITFENADSPAQTINANVTISSTENIGYIQVTFSAPDGCTMGEAEKNNGGNEAWVATTGQYTYLDTTGKTELTLKIPVTVSYQAARKDQNLSITASVEEVRRPDETELTVGTVTDVTDLQVTHTNHDFDNGTRTKEPTCEQPGTLTRHCLCGETQDSEIPKNNHTWGDVSVNWSYENGVPTSVTASVTCSNSNCDLEASNNTETITVTGDKITKTTQTAANCTTPGTDRYTATIDAFQHATEKNNTTKSVDVDVPANGHKITFTSSAGDNKFDWTEVSNTEATATVTVKCENPNCDGGYGGDGKQVTVEGITFGTKDATCTQPGTVTFTGTVSIPDEKHADNKWELTDTHNKQVNALGHDWENATYNTPVWTGYTAATATLTCARNTEESCVLTVNGDISSEETKPASCTATGTKVYTATFDFSARTNGVVTTKTDTKEEGLSALGHQWAAAPVFKWTGSTSTDVNATATMACTRSGCDKGYDKTPLPMNVTVAQKSVTTPAKCDADGTAVYTATASHPEVGSETYTNDKEDVVLPKLGHDFADPKVTWAGDENNNYQGTKVTWTCKNDSGHTKVENATVKTETVQASYESDGKTTWTASVANVTVQSPDKIDPAKFDGTTANGGVKEKVLPMLKPTVTDPTTQTPTGVTVKNDDLPAASDIQTQVQNALQGSASGLDAELAAELEKQGSNTTTGMNVATNLVVTDAQSQKPEIPGTQSADIKKVYDIHIEVTVSGGGITGELKGRLEQITDPISFTVPKPDNGPIFRVMRYHDGQWQSIGFTVSGSSIVFSSDRFSEFAILSSNDLKNAAIDSIPDQTYTGSEIKPAVKVTINGGATELKEGTDYTVEYANNTNVGTATVTIKGIGNYTGSQTINFQIVEAASTSTGTGSTTSGTKTAPNTGDETPVALYAGILTLCAAGLAVIFTKRKKTR